MAECITLSDVQYLFGHFAHCYVLVTHYRKRRPERLEPVGLRRKKRYNTQGVLFFTHTSHTLVVGYVAANVHQPQPLQVFFVFCFLDSITLCRSMVRFVSKNYLLAIVFMTHLFSAYVCRSCRFTRAASYEDKSVVCRHRGFRL